MEYKQLEQANKAIQTTDIKGKDYAEVNQRIKAFRMVEPNGSIETEILSLENGVCVMKTTVKDANGKVLGVGHAYEKEGSTFINKTSYIENCETSAVGRALGMLGIGIDTSVASYEEVANAMKNQEAKPSKDAKIDFFIPTREGELDLALLSECHALNIDLNKVATYYKKTVDQLTNADLDKAIKQKKKAMGGTK